MGGRSTLKAFLAAAALSLVLAPVAQAQAPYARPLHSEIGRASCRERVCWIV